MNSTEHEDAIITPCILAKAKKRNYQSFSHSRTPNIWPTREALLEYEEALQISAQMDELLSGATFPRNRSRSIATKTPAPTKRSATTTPSKASLRGDKKGEEGGRRDDELVLQENPRNIAAKAAKDLLEKVYPKWKSVLEVKPDADRPAALERFECGTSHSSSSVHSKILIKCS